MNNIIVTGAKQHNLKNINVTIPRNKLTVITGISGSGKSSLAFDTLYAEGQRRYVESLSAYARQFLDQMQKPEVESITGLSPAISIEQRVSGSNPRSTVATTTEIYDYLRLLYANIGIPHCPKCSERIRSQSPQAIVNYISTFTQGKKLILMSPFVTGKKGEHKDIIEKIRKLGFVRARIDGEIKNIDEDEISLRRNFNHSIEAVIDRLIIGKSSSSRLSDSVELALKHGDGIMRLLIEEDKNVFKEETVSEHLACIKCNLSFGNMLPRNFSFNSPYGACSKCHGLGETSIFSVDAVIPDKSRSIKKGAIPLWRQGPRRLIRYYTNLLTCLAQEYNFSLNTAFSELPEDIQNIIIYGTGKKDVHFDFRWGRRRYVADKPFEGLIPNLTRRFNETESIALKEKYQKIMSVELCPNCKGKRLNPVSLSVSVGDLSIEDFTTMNINDAEYFIKNLTLNTEEKVIAQEILKEISSRLSFLKSVGLNYLTLNRKSGTLSGGESQRIRLATQIGSGLVGVLYILDEPSIGLHQRDNKRLLTTLKKMRDLGNTVIVVEHDPETILAADMLIDLGPRAGRHGGELIYAGVPSKIVNCKESLTGAYISGRSSIEIPKERLKGNGNSISIRGASENNLKKINVKFPLGTFSCVTGVSGSGKSTLVNQILKNAIAEHFKKAKTGKIGKHTSISGINNINGMIIIDQSPIGRTPRSNPVTYIKAFDIIRDIFAMLPDSKIRAYKKGRFSFNVKGGRCEECKGDGIKKIEMQFLPDVYVSCDACTGKRYNDETLTVKYKGKNISDVLNMTVNEGCDFFKAIPLLYKKLKTLADVGLGYIHLGQSATTLSGGEAQRVKLALELSKTTKGGTLYILDEPTTGLHMADIHKLLEVLISLRDQGNSVIVIEHNLDVIKVADYIIDLGPEGGDDGGELIVCGTPEKVAKCAKSYTGKYIKKLLK